MPSRRAHIVGAILRCLVRALFKSRFGIMGVSHRRAVYAREARRTLEELGPTFIKAGQLLSVRPDLVPAEYLAEFGELRDSVAPLPFNRIAPYIEQALGCRLDAAFSDIQPAPFASASIAQVYRATLLHSYRTVNGHLLERGTPLAIKVVRPGTRESIERDMGELRSLVKRFGSRGIFKRIDLASLVEEFAGSLADECDLTIEGRAGERFAHRFKDDLRVCTPEIIWPLSGSKVLTMTYIEGWTLDEAGKAQAAGVDAKQLAVHGAEVFMRQVLEFGHYHADLHPSNLLITPQGEIAYLDFGIAGVLDRPRREAAAQILLATIYGDAERAIEYSAQLGLIIPSGRRTEVTASVKKLMEQTLQSTPRDIEGYATGFLGILADENISIPQGFGLLVKGLLTVQGCSKLIYPDIDIIETAKPYVTQLVAELLVTPARITKKMPDMMRAAFIEFLR